MERFLDEQKQSSMIFNNLNSKHHKLSVENQVAMIGTSLVNISDGTRQQKHPEQGKQQLHTNNHPNKWKLKHQNHHIKCLIESHKWNISTGPSVRCQVFPILPCVSPSVWHGFWSQPTLVEMLDSSVWRGEVGLVAYSVLGIFSHQSTALVIKMSMMMNTEKNHASKEISANHDQYDVAAVADGNDEDNQPQPFPHYSPALEHPNPQKSLPSCNCLKKEPLPIDPIGPKKWEKWSLERSSVGMASHTCWQRNCL